MEEVLPEATLDAESALDMTYALPEEALGRAPALFREIEEMQSKEDAGGRLLVDWGPEVADGGNAVSVCHLGACRRS